MFDETMSTPIQQIDDEEINSHGVELFMKREDLTDPIISGNKFRKLKYNLLEAKRLGFKRVLTFGGAYSNHIHAVAYAGKKFGFETIGLIRGEETIPLNPTLKEAVSFGMHTYYIDRSAYRDKHSSEFRETLTKQFGEFFLIPEGGSNALAVKGCTEILNVSERQYHYVCCACGTGGTIAGLIISLAGKQNLLGFPALKNGSFLKKDISALISSYTDREFRNWKLVTDFHFGGYAKYNDQLISFINRFKRRHKIQLDPIYTGKMVFGIFELINSGYFVSGEKILAIHTGGLQGIRGFNERFGPLIETS